MADAAAAARDRDIFFVSVQAGDNRAVYNYLAKTNDPNVVTSNGRTGLHIAALSGHQDVFNTLLSKGADPDWSDSEGITPLMCASQQGNEATVNSLLEKGVDVTKKEKGGKSAVFYALSNGHVKIAENLEQKVPCVRELKEEDIASIMMRATKENWIDVVKFLKDRNCHVTHNSKQQVASAAGLNGHIEILKLFDVKFDEKTADGRSPLRGAVQNGFYDCVKYMLENGCDVTKNEEITKVAIFNGHFEVLKLLCEKGARLFETDEDGDTPVQLAIIYGSFELFKYLVEVHKCPLKPSKRLGPLAHIAARGKKIEVLKYLANKSELGIDEADEDTGETALLISCQRGPIELVEFLLENGCDPSHQNHKGVTPALRAASCKLEEVLLLLAENNANLNAPNFHSGDTPILAAARNNSFSMVQFLANKGCALTSKDLTGKTVAFYAAQNNNVPLLRYIQDKVSLDEPDINGTTPLMIAIKSGALDAVKYLISIPSGCEINHQNVFGRTATHEAVLTEKMEIVKLLLDNGSDLSVVDHDGNSPLLLSLKENKCLEIVRHLVRLEQDIQATNDKLQTALHIACSGTENDAAMILLEAACSTETQDQTGATPFMLCASQGSESQAVISNVINADVNRSNCQGENAVHLAAKTGKAKIVRYYVMFGCNADQEDNLGITPLMIACSKDNLEMCEFLIRKGADVNAVTHKGETPAHFACRCGSLEILKLLHENSAKLDKPDLEGITPTMLAAAKQEQDFLEFLCCQRCNLSRTDKAMRTVLHFAVSGENESVIEFLINKGLDPNAIDEAGMSPVLLSIKLNNAAMTKLLTSHGGYLTEIFDNNSWSAAHYACQVGNLDLLKKHKNKMSFSSRTDDGENCLTIACLTGEEEVLNFLLDQRPNINFKNKKGQNALHIAAQNSHMGLIRLLLKAGIRVGEKDADGNTVLHILSGKACSSYPDRARRETETKQQQIRRIKHSLSQKSQEEQNRALKLIESQGTKKILPKECVSKKILMEHLTSVVNAGVDVNEVNNDGKSALHFACVIGSRKVINLLLSFSADVNLQDANGETPIFNAVRNGKINAVQLLLRNGADPNVSSKLNETPLSITVALNEFHIMQILQKVNGKLDKTVVCKSVNCDTIFKARNLKHLKYLISIGFDCKKPPDGIPILHRIVSIADVRLLKEFTDLDAELVKDLIEVKDADHNTALHLAIMRGRLDIAAVLVQMGCQTDLKNNKEHTVLHVAAIENKLALVKWVCEKCPNTCLPSTVEPDTLSPLQLAAIKGNLEVFKFLEQKGFSAATRSKDGMNCGHYAAIHGNLHILEHINKNNSEAEAKRIFGEKNESGFIPIQCAVLNGHEKIANYLHEIEPSLPDGILHQALELGNQHMVDWVKARTDEIHPVDPQTGDNSLRAAVSSGNFHLVKRFINAINLNSKNKHGNTPAQMAAAQNFKHLVSFLKEQNAQLDIPDNEGDTGISDCAIRGHLDMIKLLAEFGCDIRHKNLRQRSIVHLACIGLNQKGHLNILKFAQEQELDLDEPDIQRNTGLMYACRQGFNDIVNFLLSEGSRDPNKTNLNGSTAAHLATMAGQSDILDILSQYGARLDAGDSDNVTPLMIAVHLNSIDCINKLGEKALQSNGSDKDRLVRLATWASSDVRKVMEMLLAVQLPVAEGERPVFAVKDINLEHDTSEESPSETRVPSDRSHTHRRMGSSSSECNRTASEVENPRFQFTVWDEMPIEPAVSVQGSSHPDANGDNDDGEPESTDSDSTSVRA